MNPMCTTRLLAVAAMLLALGQTAGAQTLPLVVDASADAESPAFWWADEAVVPSGAFDEALFARAEAGTIAMVSPAAADPSGAISRLFRRADIPINNARSLAGLYGCTQVLMGQVTEQGGESVAWLGLERAVLVAELQLYDVDNGTLITDTSLSASAVAATSEDALRVAAERLIEDLAARMAAVRPVQSAIGDPTGAPVVVVAGAGTALPYVSFRAALREAHPGVIEVQEAWAAEGVVALAVSLDEGVVFDDVAAAVSSWSGTTIDDLRVEDVVTNESGILVIVDSALPGVGE